MAFFRQELAIDLGTANTVIFGDGQVVLDEPSIIAVDAKTGKLMAIGNEAQLWEEHTNPRINTVRPLMNGVIADYDAAEMMLTGFIHKALGKRARGLFKPALKVVIGIPGGSTPVDMRSIRDSASHAGAHELYMIYEPMASALGIGLDVNAPVGNMIVDIGGGTTEIAVISLGDIVESESIHVAGNELTNDIIDYVAQQHNIHIGRTTADQIKFQTGAVLSDLGGDAPEPIVVTGRNLMTGLPLEVAITYDEVAHCIDKTIVKIEGTILKVLQRTPPELYSNIVKNGIWLAGGGALLRGLAERFSHKVNIPFRVAEDPLKAVARGTCLALKGTKTKHPPYLMD